MDVIVFWMLFSVLVGVYASGKGRSGFGYFLLAALVSPLIGAVIVAILSPMTSKLEDKQVATGRMKKCGNCAEVVKMDAKACKHCNYEFAPYKG